MSTLGFPERWLSSKESAGTANCLQCRCPAFNPWVGKIPLERKWQPTLVFSLGNPMDRGAWWATVHGIAKELDMTQQLNKNNEHFR